jgi:NAD(P)-dependent dehydrogenase (short-subunit alcohol dehydrogenase family)
MEKGKTMLIDKIGIARDFLSGKVAVVTGAGQGIGRETSRILAHLGARVVIAEYRDTGSAVVNLIESEGGEALFVKTDVSDRLRMDFLKQKVHEVYGEVDILVNNAAHYVLKPVLDHTLEEWDRVIEVNLRGAFLGIKAFLPDMLRTGSGVIVTFESTEGMPYLASYMATKVGLRSLASSLALEIGKESGVNVFCYGPGMVDTEGGGAAFRKLSTMYGQGMQDFVAGGLISTELSATGLVGAILHAVDFNGEDTDYISGLGKIGLNSEGNLIVPVAEPVFTLAVPETAAAKPAPSVPEESPAAAESTAVEETSTIVEPSKAVNSSSEPVSSEPMLSPIELNEKLEEILEISIKENDRLPMFVRPVVRRQFQQGTGRKMNEWLTLAEDMSRKLSSGKVRATYVGEYVELLKSLDGFMSKQESESRSWFKKPEDLKLALDGLAARRKIIAQLIDALKK